MAYSTYPAIVRRRSPEILDLRWRPEHRSEFLPDSTCWMIFWAVFALNVDIIYTYEAVLGWTFTVLDCFCTQCWYYLHLWGCSGVWWVINSTLSLLIEIHNFDKFFFSELKSCFLLFTLLLLFLWSWSFFF